MSVRAIRKYREALARAVPRGAAAVIFERDGDDLEVRVTFPAGFDPRLRGPMPEPVALAMECARHAREVLTAPDPEAHEIDTRSSAGPRPPWDGEVSNGRSETASNGRSETASNGGECGEE